jgi:hypothetical protein
MQPASSAGVEPPQTPLLDPHIGQKMEERFLALDVYVEYALCDPQRFRQVIHLSVFVALLNENADDGAHPPHAGGSMNLAALLENSDMTDSGLSTLETPSVFIGALLPILRSRRRVRPCHGEPRCWL